MKRIQIQAPCKINLALRVYERMPNNYHRIETVLVKLALADEIDIQMGEGDRVQSYVPGIPDDVNLAVRAARAYLLAANLKKDIQIQIKKHVPIGGGLGGGSADAAGVLRALQLELGGVSDSKLLEMAAHLGADVPFLASPSTWGFAGGVGEKLTPWPTLPSRPVILCNPGFSVSTPEAYKALQRPLTYQHPSGSSFAPQMGPNHWNQLEMLFQVGNDLQGVVEKMYPEVAKIRKSLQTLGSSFTQMSGSGSTVFALFDSKEKAELAMPKLNSTWQAILTKTLSTE